MIKNIVTFLNRLIPKKDMVLFSSFPDFSDNAFVLYEYMRKKRPDLMSRYKVLWAQDPPYDPAICPVPASAYVRKNSVRGYWYFLRARYVICTHNYFYNVRSGHGQKQINLWHGNGYKRLATNTYRGDYTLATSPLYQKVQAEAVGVREDHVLVTGLPRNDLLFEEADSLKRLGIDKSTYRNIIIWLPTYRVARDGRRDSENAAETFGASDVLGSHGEAINEILKKNNTLLLIKPHPMDILNDVDAESFDHVRFVPNDVLIEKGINLYHLMNETTALISDYSSVIVDYLLLDQPIAIVSGDIDVFRDHRGYVFDNLEDYLPGPVITTREGFLDYLENFDDINAQYEEKRLSLKKDMHTYDDAHSSERVCHEIFDKGI